MQITITPADSMSNDGVSPGVSNPWSEYVKMLPSYVPVPTMWTENERTLLAGTSLEVGDKSPFTILHVSDLLCFCKRSNKLSFIGLLGAIMPLELIFLFLRHIGNLTVA
jgi:hypothetical protein